MKCIFQWLYQDLSYLVQISGKVNWIKLLFSLCFALWGLLYRHLHTWYLFSNLQLTWLPSPFPVYHLAYIECTGPVSLEVRPILTLQSPNQANADKLWLYHRPNVMDMRWKRGMHGYGRSVTWSFIFSLNLWRDHVLRKRKFYLAVLQAVFTL